MQAFKLYRKLTKEFAIPNILMYLGIFAIMLILTNSSNAEKPVDSFNSYNVRTAIINNDDGEISKQLESFISKNTKRVEVNDNEEELKDALFFYKAEFILIIPKGFSDKFGTEDALKLEHLTIPNSASSGAVSLLIDKYLNTAKLYLDGTGEIDFEKVNSDLSKSIDTQIVTISSKKSAYNPDSFFVIFMAYPIMSSLFFSLPIINVLMNKDEIKKRTLCAPISYTKYSYQIFLGNIILTSMVFAFFILLGVITGNLDLSIKNHQFVIINAALLCVVILSISFFISLLVPENAISPLATTLALGFSFLGGVFVPQSLLGKNVLLASNINPAYWYVKGVDTIMALSDFSFSSMKSVYAGFIMLLLFAFAFLSMSLVVIKMKRQSN